MLLNRTKLKEQLFNLIFHFPSREQLEAKFLKKKKKGRGEKRKEEAIYHQTLRNVCMSAQNGHMFIVWKVLVSSQRCNVPSKVRGI